MSAGHGEGGFSDAFAQFGRGDDFGLGAPAHHPAFHLPERAQRHREFEPRVGGFAVIKRQFTLLIEKRPLRPTHLPAL